MTYLEHFNTRKSGFIVTDVMLALAIAAIMVSGMTALTLEAQALYDRTQTRAALLSVYQEHAGEFADLMPYEERIRIYPIGTTSESVTIEARGRWYGNDRIETLITSKQGKQSVSFQSVRNYPFSSPSDAAGTPLCSPVISRGASPSAATITPIILPINPLLPLTDIEVRNRIAYISTDSATAADPDMIIADISDPKRPTVLSTLNTGPGLRSITLVGEYVLAAAASTAAQLHVIRLDSLASPTLIKKYQLPLPASSTTPPMGSSIYYDQKVIYLGTEKWAGNEFQTIDVSIPSDPRIFGGFEIDSKVNDIVVRNKLAYVASASRNQIQTLDAKNSNSPFLVNAFTPSGGERQEGKTIAAFEDSLNAGRTSGGFDIAADHEVFVWPPASSTPLSLNVPGGVYGLVADRSHIYLATRNVNREFTILDRSLATSSAVYYSLPVLPQVMTCDLDRLYILAHNAPAIYEVTFK